MSLTASEVHELKKAPPVEGVLPVIHERWSPRSFAEREVSAKVLHKVFEAARWAASSYNEQPWRYLVGRRGDGTWQKIYDTLIDFNKKWAQTAPVLILGLARTHFSHNEAENRFALYDLGAASSYLTLEAAALGLKSHQMAGFDQEAARRALTIPGEFAIGSVIALGYQGEPVALADAVLIDREIEPRKRKPLDEIVFSEWGKAAEI
jgi:nitroreductase